MNEFQKMYAELETASHLPKCQQCGCMAETLNNLITLLPTVDTAEARALTQQVALWKQGLQPIDYTCLGCEHCYPAVAQNAFGAAFPSAEAPALSCDFQTYEDTWPPVVGEYFVVDRSAAVAVSTLANVQLAEALAKQQPPGLAIVGKTETENIGVDKIVKNMITNPALQHLIIAGGDSKGHRSGETLLALSNNGIDEQGTVIGSPGKRPILRNVSAAEIEAFRAQVQVVDMIGCDDILEISARIEALVQAKASSCGCSDCAETPSVLPRTAPTIIATAVEDTVKMDRAGYFVIVPRSDKACINVEHYGYDHTLLHIIEGDDARTLSKTIIANGWVSELSHAAYLGRELAKAELSIKHNFRYVQDGA